MSGFVVLNQPALELSKTPALSFPARGASPLMRERRINKSYDALFGGQLQTKFQPARKIAAQRRGNTKENMEKAESKKYFYFALCILSFAFLSS